MVILAGSDAKHDRSVAKLDTRTRLGVGGESNAVGGAVG